MNSFGQLAACISGLATDAKRLSTYCQDSELPIDLDGGKKLQPLVPHDFPNEAHQIKRSILSNVTRLQTLLIGPSDFLQQLACQNQLLACLQWLGEFQVLACIPLSGTVPLNDVSDLAGVPEAQLCRVVRMAASAGFLQEPQPGQIAHSALSAPFVTKPSYLDAAMFLAGTAAPAALQMAAATQRFGTSQSASESAYNLAMNTTTTFCSTCEQRPKLRRQWPAYQRYGLGDVDDSTVGILKSLGSLDRLRTGHPSVVEIGAKSTERAMTLANHYPTLHLIVQMNSPGPGARPGSSSSLNKPLPPGPSKLDQNGVKLDNRITVQQRAPGTPQNVRDAAVYILDPDSSSLGSSSERILAELRAHIDVLRANSSSTLILTPRLLPDFGTVRPDAEATARLRDLTIFQLANDRDVEMSELLSILNSVSDNMGRLVLVNKVFSGTSGAVALEIRYQAYANGW